MGRHACLGAVVCVFALSLHRVDAQWAEHAASAAGGGISQTATDSVMASLALDANGHPTIAWCEWVGTDAVPDAPEIYVRTWNGTAWVELNGSATGRGISKTPLAGIGGFSMKPSVAIDPTTGYPAVAWLEGFFLGLFSNVHFRRWNGSLWEELNGSATLAGLSNGPAASSASPSVVIDTAGHPFVVWSEGDAGPKRVLGKKWNGTSWVGIGGSDQGAISLGTGGAGDCLTPDMKLDSAGRPVVVWGRGGIFIGEVFLRRWDGSAWVGVGSSDIGNGISGLPVTWCRETKVALAPDDRPYVTWQEPVMGGYSGVTVAGWEGGAWNRLGPASASGGVHGGTTPYSNYPSLAVDPTGRPIVAWSEGPTSISPPKTDIFLKRWDGTAWIAIEGSAGQGGLSGTPTSESSLCSLVVSRQGNLSIAWSDRTGTLGEIYFKEWTHPVPALLEQLQVGSPVPVPVGGEVAAGSIRLQASVSTGTTTLPLRFQVEIRPLGTPFLGSFTDQSDPVGSGTASCLVTGLPVGSYHWQGRIADPYGLGSPWVTFGGNPETEIDFSVVPPQKPQGPSGLFQADYFGTELAVGSGTRDARVEFRATMTTFVEAGILEIEMRPVGTPFAGTPNLFSVSTASGAMAAVSNGDPLTLGDYHWQARVRGDSGQISSWVEFGENPEEARDFTVEGPVGKRTICFQAGDAGSSFLGMVLTLVAILYTLGRRRSVLK